MLLQKAEIKKRHIERNIESSKRMRDHFIESYNQLLNSSLSQTLLNIKESILNLKKRLIKELKANLKKLIKENIEKDYSNYINSLINRIKDVSPIIDKPPRVTILLNNLDFNYFNKNFGKIENLFKNEVGITRTTTDFIGGFKVITPNEDILYDYSIDNLINKKSPLIEIEFSKLFDESKVKNLEKDFEQFIQKNKLDIDEILREYDRV
jgi:vacuolar-type H+-ATPase subunit E/Vma4